MVTSAVLSPCVGVCQLDGYGYCVGCHRSGAEIASWLGLPALQRQHLMDHVLPARENRDVAGFAQPALLWANAIKAQ